MAIKKTLLILLLLLLAFSIIGCNNDDENPCNLKGERMGEIKFDDVQLFFNALPNESYEEPYILYIDGSAVLVIGTGLKGYGRICNFPHQAAGWDVPPEGFKVEVEGIEYKYLGVYPHDRIVFDLELTSIKRK